MTGSRIRQRFDERRAEGRAALVPYVTAGFPSPEATREILAALAAAGADVIELGIPFSDPLADGPTIQRSSFRALQEGTTVVRVLSALREFRRGDETPVVLFTYLNPVLRYGFPRFLEDACAAGADGILLTDLPAGADPGLEDRIAASPLDLIRLTAPTTTLERVVEVAAGGSGFLYYISRTGVTGARSALRDELAAEVRRIREAVTLPVAVGFGISTPEQAAQVATLADGVVIGSALIGVLEDEGVAGVRAFLSSLRAAMDRR